MSSRLHNEYQANLDSKMRLPSQEEQQSLHLPSVWFFTAALGTIIFSANLITRVSKEGYHHPPRALRRLGCSGLRTRAVCRNRPQWRLPRLSSPCANPHATLSRASKALPWGSAEPLPGTSEITQTESLVVKLCWTLGND